MNKKGWALAIAALVVISIIAAQRDFSGPFSMLLGIVSVILLYRIGNILEKGFSEHTAAMLALYEETCRNNRPANPPAPPADPGS
jgi:Sec-independent protein secretion pathway component TatC